MAVNIFSVNYIACIQRQFEQSIEEGNLERAMGILEKIPNGSSASEKLQRLIVLKEGYQTIAVEYTRPNNEPGKYNEIKKRLGEAEIVLEIINHT